MQEFKSLTDGFLAYTFEYPATINGKPTNIIFSRKPERYSSAAPLTPDARQRIVAELVSFPDGITISVSVRWQPCLRVWHDSVLCNVSFLQRTGYTQEAADEPFPERQGWRDM